MIGWYPLMMGHGGPLGNIGDFAELFVIIYIATLAVMLATGGVVLWLNHRHPERRIQTRRSVKSARQDIGTSLLPLSVTSLCLAFGLFAQAKGWTIAPWPISWWSVPVSAVVLIALQDAWFYWTHRLLHTRRFVRHHRPHHLNLAPTVLSSDDSSVVDTLFAHTFYALVPFVLPVAPLVLVIHRLVDQVSGMIGHCGFEHFASPTTRRPWPLLCTVFHDQHHEHYSYTSVIYTSMWDRLCGTLHHDYDAKVRRFEHICAGRPAAPAATVTTASGAAL